MVSCTTYFDTDHAVVQDVVDNELDPLLSAVEAIVLRVRQDPDAP
jgi:hypothetical protein